MSPAERKRPTGKGRGDGAGRRRGALPRQRLGLLVFGVLLIVLFVLFAAAQGLGSPDVPSGDVAKIEDVPGEVGTITQADFDHAFEQAVAQAGLKKAPKPGDAQYEDIKKTALGSLLDAAWLQGEADEMGVSASDEEIADKLKEIKQQNFKSNAEYRKFLKKSHYTASDVDERVELQLLTEKIQEKIINGASTPSDSQIEDYYEAAKDTQFTTPETRDVRTILNKDRKKVEAAKAQLEKDDSEKSWKKVAKRYSTDTVTKSNGGLQAGVAEGSLEEPLGAAAFKASEGKLEGPIKGKRGYYIFVVEKVTPEKVQSLDEARPQISSQLSQTNQQEIFSRFVTNYNSKWQSRTFCAAGFVIERCANYKGEAHSASAPPACYEANPKGGLPEACPAPVQQLAPALPGSITLLSPQGQRMPQRPRPAGLSETSSESEVPLFAP